MQNKSYLLFLTMIAICIVGLAKCDSFCTKTDASYLSFAFKNLGS